ncbi:hypothetical protein D3C86_1617790 [compost metagenome]
MHDGLARREDALGVRVTRRIGQVAHHVLLDLLRGIETEHGQVADVQLDDLVPFLLHLPGLFQHRAADVIANVLELVRFLDGFHGGVGDVRAGCRSPWQRIFGIFWNVLASLGGRRRIRGDVPGAWQTGRQKL